MMTSPSDHSESPSAQPLLQNFDNSQKRDQSVVSLRSLEDGSDSAYEIGNIGPHRRQGFWRRLRMSIRRRRNEEVRNEDFKSAKLGGDEKRRSQKLRWRKRTVIGLPVLVMSIL
jgi:hypothetical protein